MVVGAHMRLARGDRTQSDVAAATGKLISKSVYSRIENGEVRIDKPHVVPVLLDVLGVPASPYFDLLTELAFDASKEGWASRFRIGHREAVPDSMLRLTSLEQSAIEQYVVDRNTIPGQLQTEPYARLVTAHTLPASMRDAGMQDVVVGVRLERVRRSAQRRIAVRSTERFFIDQAALYAHFGRPDILADQLQVILDLVEDRSLSVGIRVITSRYPLAVPVNTLTRLGFGKGPYAVPDVIYNEVGRQAFFHRGPLPGTDEAADADYVDLDDLIDNVIMRAPGYRDSRRLIETALLEAKFLLR
ncbi:Scr1 family TA system antitoxin-like transcriptional regulator [Kitasatospora griseola]